MIMAVHKKTSHIIYLKYVLLENQVNHGKSENTTKYQIVKK